MSRLRYAAPRWLWRAILMTLVYLVLLVCIGLAFIVFSDSAPRWLWQQSKSYVPELRIDGISGSLASGLDIKQLSWRNDSMALQVDELAVSISFSQLVAGRFALAKVHAKSVAGQALKPSAEPSAFLPPTIHLPLLWGLPEVHIAQLQWTAFQSQALSIEALKLSAQGHGSTVSIKELSAAYNDWRVMLQAELRLQEQWPIDATLTVASEQMASQRITFSGDLSALHVRLRGPEQYPIGLEVTANVLLPTLPFRGRVSWPQWLPPGQLDWRLEPGAMTFAGNTEQGELALDLSASLLEGSSLEWPKNTPRSAHLSGPLRWQRVAEHLAASIDWQGKLGSAPWLVKAHFDQAKTAQAVFSMRLADAAVNAKGWLDSGVVASIRVPHLQRFQTQISGALSSDIRWQGAWPEGDGRANIELKALAQRSANNISKTLLQEATIALSGGVKQHQITIDALSEQGSVSIKAAGAVSLKRSSWDGFITQATIAPNHSRWQLRQAVDLSISADESHLANACWQQTDEALSPWQACLRADLSPKQWLAALDVQAPQGGELSAQFRRDPSAKTPALDGDLQWQNIHLSELPIAVPEGLMLAGQSHGDVSVSGQLDKPILKGEWAIAASLSWPRYGLEWPELQANGHLLGERANWLLTLKDSSNGQLSISGEAGWQPSISLSAAITGDKLAFAYAPWVQGVLSPTIDIAWLNEQLAINGEVLINQADITLKSLAAGAPKPSSDLVLVRDRDGQELTINESPQSLPLQLGLRVVLGKAITLSGYGLDAGLKGQLLLTQTPQTSLAVNGEISLKPDAKFAAYGQNLDIEQGRLLFAGPVSTPDIRLSASREIDGIKVGVNVIGLAPKPAVTLSSDTPMSQDEILSYLVLGRALGGSQEASAADKQALALSAALNLTGKTGAVSLLGERIGISDLAIATQGDSDATEVAVSGRLSEKVWLSIGRGVFQPSQSVTVRYQINRRLSLEALSALESAITLFYSWRF